MNNTYSQARTSLKSLFPIRRLTFPTIFEEPKADLTEEVRQRDDAPLRTISPLNLEFPSLETINGPGCKKTSQRKVDWPNLGNFDQSKEHLGLENLFQSKMINYEVITEDLSGKDQHYQFQFGNGLNLQKRASEGNETPAKEQATRSIKLTKDFDLGPKRRLNPREIANGQKENSCQELKVTQTESPQEGKDILNMNPKDTESTIKEIIQTKTRMLDEKHLIFNEHIFNKSVVEPPSKLKNDQKDESCHFDLSKVMKKKTLRDKYVCKINGSRKSSYRTPSLMQHSLRSITFSTPMKKYSNHTRTSLRKRNSMYSATNPRRSKNIMGSLKAMFQNSIQEINNEDQTEVNRGQQSLQKKRKLFDLFQNGGLNTSIDYGLKKIKTNSMKRSSKPISLIKNQNVNIFFPDIDYIQNSTNGGRLILPPMPVVPEQSKNHFIIKSKNKNIKGFPKQDFFGAQKKDLGPKKRPRRSRRGCNCQKSQCSKRNCLCLKQNGFCGPHCRCLNCKNQDTGILKTVNSPKVIKHRLLDDSKTQMDKKISPSKVTAINVVLASPVQAIPSQVNARQRLSGPSGSNLKFENPYLLAVAENRNF